MLNQSPILNTSANLAWAIFEKSKCLDYFQNNVFVGQLGDASETEILSHNYWQALRGASLSMRILTR